MDEKEIWFYLDITETDESKQVQGPVSERDLDVLLRTNVINSSKKKNSISSMIGTLVFKQGMEQWVKLFSVEELRMCLLEQAKEIFQLQQALPQPSPMERRKSSDFMNHNNNHTLSPKKLVQSPEQQDRQLEEYELEEHNLDEDCEVVSEGDENNEQLNDEQKLEILKKKLEKNRKKTQQQKQKKKKQWYQPRINSNIYITGLPPDITDEEMSEFFGRAGIIRINPQSLQPTVKIYRGQDGTTGYRVCVKEAEFQQKGDYKPREKKEIDKMQQVLARQKEMSLLQWEGEIEGEAEGLKIVILKNMFTRTQAQDEEFMQELYSDVLQECEEAVGTVHKLEVFVEHSEGIIIYQIDFFKKGVIKVKFKSAHDAEQCISIMNDRFFDGRQIKAFYWDGKIDYRKEALRENLQDEEQRLDEFGKWLEEGDEKQDQKEQAV